MLNSVCLDGVCDNKGHVRRKGKMRVRNRVCFESDRGNRATRGKPVEQRGEDHITNSNYMRQTPTVHNGIRTRVLRGDKRKTNLVAIPRPLTPTQIFFNIFRSGIVPAKNTVFDLLEKIAGLQNMEEECSRNAHPG